MGSVVMRAWIVARSGRVEVLIFELQGTGSDWAAELGWLAGLG